jgi:hypothetical protein
MARKKRPGLRFSRSTAEELKAMVEGTAAQACPLRDQPPRHEANPRPVMARMHQTCTVEAPH